MLTKKDARNATPADTPSANMAIYTRQGDKGKTSLYGGKTVSKGSSRVEAYGTVDELNSLVGVIAARMDGDFQKELFKIQNDLLEIGSHLANPNSKDGGVKKYLGERVTDFEKIIDSIEKELPELENFILPGGSERGSLIHLARSVARRAERNVVRLADEESVSEGVIIYLNRLSDLFFDIARKTNFDEQKTEVIWKKL